jgi:hypothetical protein
MLFFGDLWIAPEKHRRPIVADRNIEVFLVPSGQLVRVLRLEKDATDSFDASHYHNYRYAGAICRVSRTCTPELVFRTMLTDRTFVAPAYEHRPVTNCASVVVDFFATPNRVTMLVDESALSVTNYADPGHWLYPGLVRRRVFQDGDTVDVETVGEGTSNGFIRLQNLFAAPIIWSNADRALRVKMIAKSRGG